VDSKKKTKKPQSFKNLVKLRSEKVIRPYDETPVSFTKYIDEIHK